MVETRQFAPPPPDDLEPLSHERAGTERSNREQPEWMDKPGNWTEQADAFVAGFVPEGLFEIITDRRPMREDAQSRLLAEVEKIDYLTLQYLFADEVHSGDDDPWPYDQMRDFVIREKGGMDGVIDGLHSVVEGMRPTLDERGQRREGVVNSLTGGNFSGQYKIFEQGMHAWLSDIADPKVRGLAYAGLSGKSGEQYYRPHDSDSFVYHLLSEVNTLADRSPENRQEWERLLLHLLDVLQDEMWYGGSGVWRGDTDLSAEEHPDLPLLPGKVHDSVISGQIQQLLFLLSKNGSRESIDTLLEFYKKHSARFLLRIANVMDRVDPEYSVSKLLPLLHDDDEYTRKGASAICYRLELGKIGISKGVVEYLSRKYELMGAKKDAVNFAHRITADGKVGLFDAEGALMGYFELGDLTDPEKKRQAQILEISRELLFANPDTDDSIREEFLQQYLDFYNDLFFQETGVRFNNLSLRDQVWFFRFMKDADDDTKERARAVVQEYGGPALSAFISCEGADDMGEAVLALGEHLPPETAQKVFQRYVDIAHRADMAGKYLTERFGAGVAARDTVATEIARGLLTSARRVLAQAKDVLTARGTQFNADDESHILDSLRQADADVLMFAHTFRVASEEGHIDLADIVGTTLESKDTKNLSPKEQDAMFKIFSDNRKGNPRDYPPELLAGRLSDFKELVQTPGKKWYVFKDGDTVLAFVHYEDKEDEKGPARYLGSFNVAAGARGQRIGTAFLQTTLEQEGADRRVILNVNGGNPYKDAYLNRFGFTVQRIEENYRGSGKPYYFLERLPAARVEDMRVAA